MQLGKRIAPSLCAATAVLLGAATGPSQAQEVVKDWKFDTSVSYYGEQDRVKDASVNLRARHWFKRGNMTLRLVFDTLTGASASGAAPALVPQTFTSPSGNGSYQVGARETPLDPSFLDTRVAFSGTWMQPLGARGELELGLSASNEYDYLHTGINAHYSLALNERNTTLGFAFALAADTIDPVGGAPIPYAPMLPVGGTGNKLGDDSKNVADFVVGVSQVLGRRTLGQFNYSYSRASGYLTDPYKVLSVLDPVTGDPVAGPGIPYLYLFETRPGDRAKHSIYVQVKHRIGRPIVDGSYRYMTDDWGVDSHTFDFRWRQPIGANWYVQPHVRYYTQTAADFYRPYLLDGNPHPDHASADYRLGDLTDTTFGVRVGRAQDRDRELAFRIEYFQQTGRAPPGAAFGSLDGLDLDSKVSALITALEYRF